jgi:hypothetical protein
MTIDYEIRARAAEEARICIYECTFCAAVRADAQIVWHSFAWPEYYCGVA